MTYYALSFYDDDRHGYIPSLDHVFTTERDARIARINLIRDEKRRTPDTSGRADWAFFSHIPFCGTGWFSGGSYVHDPGILIEPFTVRGIYLDEFQESKED